MPHIVAEPCINCRYTECASVCPVDCFYAGTNFLAIHPDECIDCGACVPVCPVSAIFPEADLPERWARYRELNDRFSRIWPRITRTRPPLPDAEAWAKVQDKAELLDPRPAPEGDEISPGR